MPERMMDNLAGFGAPVFGFGRGLVAAINIPAPSPRFTPCIDAAIASVREAAQRISNSLRGARAL